MKAELDNFWSGHRCGGITVTDSDGKELLTLNSIGINSEKVSFKSFHSDVKSHCERIAKAICKGEPDKVDFEKQLKSLPKVDSIYKHFKGNHYQVVGFTRCSDTGGVRVLYRRLSDPADAIPWDRSLTEWNEVVIFDGIPVNRFTAVGCG